MDAIAVNLTSYHINRDAKRNEKNLGIGYEVRDGYLVKMAGAYRNSFYRNTVYALVGYEPINFAGFGIGIFGGLATGYRQKIAAGIMVDYGQVSFKICPPFELDGRKTEGFIGMQLKFELGDNNAN